MGLRLTIFALLILLFLLLVACGGNTRFRADTTTADSVNITLATNPTHPQMGQVELVATVKDEQGQPINNAEVYIFANHTGHGGMDVQGKATNQGEGVYTVMTDFSMSGMWKVTVQVNQDKEIITQGFDLEVE
jgi:hypothetical protein